MPINTMSTLITLAAELNFQPYELEAYCDIEVADMTAELDADTEAFIREVVAAGAEATR